MESETVDALVVESAAAVRAAANLAVSAFRRRLRFDDSQLVILGPGGDVRRSLGRVNLSARAPRAA